MPAIAEFTDAELAAIREMLVQRYRQEVEIHLADSEVHLDQSERERDHPGTSSCPTVYWYERGTNFVVVKCAPARFRTQFFYTPHDQYGTGIDEYDNLEECVAAVLQTQADHERERAGMDSGVGIDALKR